VHTKSHHIFAYHNGGIYLTVAKVNASQNLATCCILRTLDSILRWASSQPLESRGTVCSENRSGLGDAVREREFEIGNEKLLDVWPSDVLRLLDLNHTKNLTVDNSNDQK
jgi:hypothetical protein